MKRLVYILLVVLLVIIAYPVFVTIIHSFMGVREIELNIGSIFSGNKEMVYLPLMPSYPTLGSYKNVLLYADKFYQMFWNSCLYCFSIILGQIIVSAPAAYVFSRYEFRWKKLLFWFYILVMLMPFQVVMLSEYLVLKRIGVLDTALAIILPGIFGTYPVFILTKVFQTIPEEIFEAAKLDGANKFKLYSHICLPVGKGGIMSVVVLGFLEVFNMIEQPLIFLKNKNLRPLSLFFPKVSLLNAGEVFAASVIIMIPAVLVFVLGEDSLEKGIKAFGIKK